MLLFLMILTWLRHFNDELACSVVHQLQPKIPQIFPNNTFIGTIIVPIFNHPSFPPNPFAMFETYAFIGNLSYLPSTLNKKSLYHSFANNLNPKHNTTPTHSCNTTFQSISQQLKPPNKTTPPPQSVETTTPKITLTVT